MFTASLAGNYQIAAVTALILLVPSIAFMLLVERFLNTEMLAKVGWSQFDRVAGARRFPAASASASARIPSLAPTSGAAPLERAVMKWSSSRRYASA
jgi:hypothetical protein